jgi:hypothetical protein
MGKQIVPLLTILAMVFGAFFWVDGHYAKCADMKSLQNRFNIHETGTILNQKQQRLWTYEDRYGKDPAKVQDPAARQEMKQLQIDVPDLRDKLKVMESQQ